MIIYGGLRKTEISHYEETRSPDRELQLGNL